MKALVMAAGLGTRLRPLTEKRAKPSLPVLGIPTFWFAAWNLARELGVKVIGMNLSHAPESMRHAGDDRELRAFTGVRFHYSDETSGILGSSGALWKLRGWIGNETLVVCNGDSICLPGWKAMAAFHRAKGAAITLHVRGFKDAEEPYTNLIIDGDGRVIRFGEKAKAGTMLAAGYIIEGEVLARLPSGASELRPTLLEPLAAEGHVYAFRQDIPWFDIGNAAGYARAQFETLKALPETRALIESKMREVKPGCWIPKGWNPVKGPVLSGPAVLCGEQDDWTAAAQSFGPRFIGIEAPPRGVVIPTSDAIVSSSQIQSL